MLATAHIHLTNASHALSREYQREALTATVPGRSEPSGPLAQLTGIYNPQQSPQSELTVRAVVALRETLPIRFLRVVCRYFKLTRQLELCHSVDQSLLLIYSFPTIRSTTTEIETAETKSVDCKNIGLVLIKIFLID